MKKIFSLVLATLMILTVAPLNGKAQANCPDCPNMFSLSDSFCTKIRIVQNGTNNFLISDSIRACKGSRVTYTLSAGMDLCSYPGTTYTVTSISNGTVVSLSGNLLTIQWGSSSNASVTISYSYYTTNGFLCKGSFTIQAALANAPIASFTISPNPSCFNNPTTITFNATGTTNATQYYWDFGDGFTGTGIITSHNYYSPGTKCVKLIATSPSGVSGGGGSAGGTPDATRCAECVDTIIQCLTINNLPGPPIDSCHGTVCADEEATYCTSASGCGTPVWTVTGGTITGGTVVSVSPLVTTRSGVSCITVLWGSGNPQGTVNLQMTGCTTYCGSGTTINIPIIPSSILITGNNTACLGTSESYSLPAWPGVTYNWTLSGGGNITSFNTNTPSVVVNWTNTGTHTLSCNFYDSAKGCGGVGTITVNVKPNMVITGTKIFCAGQSTTLNAVDQNGNPVSATWTIAPAGTTYTPSGTSTSVSSSTPGTYIVTANSTAACNNATATLMVLAQPILGPITGPDTICPGQPYTYNVTSNTSGNFTWSVSGGSATYLTPDNSSAQIIWSNSGPYTIFITQTSTSGNCTSNPVTKTVYKYPNPTLTGATSVCADATVQYQITNISNQPFNWYISPASYGTIISGQGSNQVSIQWHGNAIGGNTNTVYLHYGLCKDDSIAITISKPVPPTITASGSLCVGTGVSLTSTGTGTFSWTSLQSPYTSSSNPAIGINVPGTYNVSITNYNGSGCNVTASYIVPDIGRPSALASASGVLNYCYPNLPNMNLVTPTGAGYSYQWFKAPSVPVGTNSPTLGVNNGAPGAISITSVGSYSYYVVVTLNNCVVTSNTITINVTNCTGGCSGKIDVTNITGCNPFNISVSAVAPSGGTIVPGSTTISYYDGSPTTSGNSTMTFDSIGYHQIRVCADIQLPGGGTTNCCLDTTVLVKLANRFLTNVNCGTVTLTDLSNVINPCTIGSHSWSVTDLSLNAVNPPIASFNNNSIASPVLTFTQSGSYIIHHTVTGCGCTVTVRDTVTISVPDASFSVSNSCVGTPVIMNGLAFMSYLWNFGDNATSYTQNTTHAYSAPGTFTVTHMVTDINGCTDTRTNTITISPKPTCNIAYSGPTSFCAGGSLALNACSGFTGYQWYLNGTSLPTGTGMSLTATQTGNYHFTAVNNNGCLIVSDTVSITVTQPASAAIVKSGGTCEGDVYTLTIPVCNTCTITWLDNGMPIPGTNNANSISINITNANLGSHVFTVTITNASGCPNTSTYSAIFNPLPTININVAPNNPTLCSGNIYTLTATSNAASPAWAWTLNQSNFVFSSNPSILASAAGTYNVSVTNGVTGCRNMASQVVSASPDLSLFPRGCDTICDTARIFLPIGSLNGNINNYTINWYDNAPPYNTPIGTGPSLNLTGLPLGNHVFSVIVTDNNTGCVDTSNNYHVFIKSCPKNGCTCDGSNWDTLYLNAAPVDTIGMPLTLPGNALNCGDDLGTGNCNQPFTINASYSCNPNSCDTSVTYQLAGTVTQSGVMPFNSTGLPAGTYTLTLTGRCGNTICKTCTLTFALECDTPQVNCCANSNWVNGPIIKEKDTQNETTISCGGTTQPATVFLINNALNNCNKSYLVAAGFSCSDSTCPGTVKYELKDSATGNIISTTTNTPLAIPTTLANGTYYVTFNGYCGDSLCKTCTFIIRKNCIKDCCEKSAWTETPKWNTVTVINGMSQTVVSPIICNESSFAINNQLGNCSTTTTVTAGYNCDTSCTSSVIYNLYKQPGNILITSSTGSLTIPSTLVNGNYSVTIYGKCGDKICDSCKFTFVKNCIDCCKGSKWASGPFWVNNITGIKTTIVSGISRFNIINSNNLCFVPFKVIGTYACGSTACGSVVTYELKDSAMGGAVIMTSTDSLMISTSLPNGTYYVVIKAYCGGMLCATSRFTIFKNCSCDCGPVANAISVNVITNGILKNYKCGTAIPAIRCTDTVTMTGTYACNQSGCPASYFYTLTGPTGTSSGSLPLTLNTLPPGTYTINIRAFCGGILCKECTYTFTVLCNTIPAPCCPYNIGINFDSTQIQYSQFSTNSMLLSNNFSLPD